MQATNKQTTWCLCVLALTAANAWGGPDEDFVAAAQRSNKAGMLQAIRDGADVGKCCHQLGRRCRTLGLSMLEVGQDLVKHKERQETRYRSQQQWVSEQRSREVRHTKRERRSRWVDSYTYAQERRVTSMCMYCSAGICTQGWIASGRRVCQCKYGYVQVRKPTQEKEYYYETVPYYETESYTTQVQRSVSVPYYVTMNDYTLQEGVLREATAKERIYCVTLNDCNPFDVYVAASPYGVYKVGGGYETFRIKGKGPLVLYGPKNRSHTEERSSYKRYKLAVKQCDLTIKTVEQTGSGNSNNEQAAQIHHNIHTMRMLSGFLQVLRCIQAQGTTLLQQSEAVADLADLAPQIEVVQEGLVEVGQVAQEAGLLSTEEVEQLAGINRAFLQAEDPAAREDRFAEIEQGTQRLQNLFRRQERLITTQIAQLYQEANGIFAANLYLPQILEEQLQSAWRQAQTAALPIGSCPPLRSILSPATSEEHTYSVSVEGLAEGQQVYVRASPYGKHLLQRGAQTVLVKGSGPVEAWGVDDLSQADCPAQQQAWAAKVTELPVTKHVQDRQQSFERIRTARNVLRVLSQVNTQDMLYQCAQGNDMADSLAFLQTLRAQLAQGGLDQRMRRDLVNDARHLLTAVNLVLAANGQHGDLQDNLAAVERELLRLQHLVLRQTRLLVDELWELKEGGVLRDIEGAFGQIPKRSVAYRNIRERLLTVARKSSSALGVMDKALQSARLAMAGNSESAMVWRTLRKPDGRPHMYAVTLKNSSPFRLYLSAGGGKAIVSPRQQETVYVRGRGALTVACEGDLGRDLLSRWCQWQVKSVEEVSEAEEVASRHADTLEQLSEFAEGLDKIATAVVNILAECDSPTSQGNFRKLLKILKTEILALCPRSFQSAALLENRSMRALLSSVDGFLQALEREESGTVLEDYMAEIEHNAAGVQDLLQREADLLSAQANRLDQETLAITDAVDTHRVSQLRTYIHESAQYIGTIAQGISQKEASVGNVKKLKRSGVHN